MSGQQYEQKAAQIPGALGREVASNEERGEQSFEGVNRPSAAARTEGRAEGKGEPFTRGYSGTEDAPTPHINVDPIRQNVAYVYSSPDDAPGSKDDVSVVRTQPEPGMEGRGEAAVRAGPSPGMPGVDAMLDATRGLAPLPAHAQGLLNLLGGGGGSASAPLTNTSGPLCANLSLPVRTALGAVPAPAANKLCDTLLDGPIDTCNLGAMVEWGLTSTASAPPKCNGLLKQEVVPGAPSALQDLRPLPYAGFDNATDLLELEGETYFWLYRTLLNFEASLGCFIANGTAWEPPAGWELYALLNLTEPASNTEGAPAGPAPGTVVLPFAAVLLNREEEQLVVAVRGTQTGAEWAIDFSYNQTAEVAALGNKPVHYGFATVFQQLWPGVEAALADLVAGASPAATQASMVFVTGHSLGGGVGTLVAYAAQSYLNQQMGAAAPAVGSVLFAPPNAGSPEFVDSFNQLVNARRLAFEYDIVPQAFCTPEMPSCPPGRLPGTVGALLTAAGISITPTTQPGDVTSWPYAQVGGSITLLPDEMAQDAASWSALSRIELCWSLPFLYATHVCSYSCALSQYAPAEASSMSLCWLSRQPAGAPGSTCPGWPTNYPGL